MYSSVAVPPQDDAIDSAPSASPPRLFSSRVAFAVVLTLGVALRLYNYVGNRSLWLDEAALAYSIVHRSFVGLIAPLDYAQVAPLGFLWLEKIAVSLFGSSEFALRLVPFLAGLASFVLFAIVASRLFNLRAAVFAVALYAANEQFIYFSVETKQYALDAAVAIAIIVLVWRVRDQMPSPQRSVILALVGALAPWCSQPSVFIVAGAGVYLFVSLIHQRDTQASRRLGAVLGCWAIGAGTATLYSFHQLSPQNRRYLDAYWSDAFLPLSSGLVPSIRWIVAFAAREFEWLFQGQHLSLLVLAIALLGGFALARRRDGTATLLFTPIVLALIASAAHLYPLATRLTLIFAPIVMLSVGAGADWLIGMVEKRTAPRASMVALFAAIFGSNVMALHELPFTREELRPALRYLVAHYQPGDVIYVYYGSGRAFQYYAPRLRIPESTYVIGHCARDHWPDYLTELNSLVGKPRVWLVLSHPFSRMGVQEGSLMTRYLSRIGYQRDEFASAGAVVQLYDLSDSTRAAEGARVYTPPLSGDRSGVLERCFDTEGK